MGSIGTIKTPNYFEFLCVIFNIVLVATKCYGHDVCSVLGNDVTETRMFVFGASVYDVGNNHYYVPARRYGLVPANHNPYGMSFTGPTGRYSDGLLIPDFIAEYAKLPYIPAVLDPNANGDHGYNFASAGAATSNIYHVINLDEQLIIFKKKTRDLEKRVLRNGVYLINIGGNDYMTFIKNNRSANEAQQQAFVNLVVQRIINVVKEIYDDGGRKFAFADANPYGCVPEVKYNLNLTELVCYDEISVIAKLHNIAIREALYKLKNSTQYSQFKYGVFDMFNQLSLRFLDPMSYGFVESKIACCGYGGGINAINCGTSPYFLCSDPSEFLLFDGVHMTQAANSQLAKLMWNGDQTVIAPYNVQQLFELQL